MDEEALQRIAKKELEKKTNKKRRSLDGKEEPEKKRKPQVKIPSREIPFDKNNLPRLKQLMGISPFHHPLTGKKGIFCSIGMEPQFFFTFPLIYEGKPQKKYSLVGCKFLAGLSNPSFVFSVLIKLFNEIHGDDPEAQLMDWELWKINQAFYGKGKSCAISWCTLLKSAHCTRPLGGDKNPAMVKIISWYNTNNRLVCSVPVSECFEPGEAFTMEDLRLLDKQIKKKEQELLLESNDLSKIKHATQCIVEDDDEDEEEEEEVKPVTNTNRKLYSRKI